MTIFGCTWVAIHPNIPEDDVKETWFTGALRRMQLTVALITPEMVILWSFRQWLAARALTKQHHKSVFIFNEVANSLMFAILRIPMDADTWFFCCHGRV